jgi:uncharacterized Zn-binding protein involved in type VI secretion
MPAAARAGDRTSHGTPLSPGLGSPNVWIGGRAAWRATVDAHACPLAEGLKPHVGGVVANGSAKVFINGLPAARVGDVIPEVGPSNSISDGFMNVQIG